MQMSWNFKRSSTHVAKLENNVSMVNKLKDGTIFST